MPPGFAMRLPRYARLLTPQSIQDHDALTCGSTISGKFRSLKVENGRPIEIRTGHEQWPLGRLPDSDWPLFEFKEVSKLEVSGIVLLYDEAGYLVEEEVSPIILANEFVTLGGKPQTLKIVLAELEEKFRNDPWVKYYKACRYRVEFRFANRYFDNFWTRDAVNNHLRFFAGSFRAREEVSRARKKPVYEWPSKRAVRKPSIPPAPGQP